MSARRGKPPAGPPSPAPLYLTFNADPTTPAYETVQMTLTNGKVTPGRACEICARVVAIGSRGSLHAFETHKSACERKNGSVATSRRTGFGDRAQSLSATRSATSLSPLMIPSSSLSPSLPGSPTSPPYSPIFSPIHSPFDIAPGSQDHQAFAGSSPPLITVDPPSDDRGPFPFSLPISPPSQTPSTVCVGVVVQWRPGTIWETYPFPSHSFVRHPWHILEVLPPEHLRLRSADCTSTVSAGGFGSVCHNCLRIPQCEEFQTIQKRAEGALPHTPHHYLTFKQLSHIPKKMKRLLDRARIKNLALSRKLVTSQRGVNDYQRLLKIIASSDVKRLKCIVGVALRRGCSVPAIIMRIESAIMGVYQARGNYSERELDIGFLAKSIGGPKLLYALCRSHGLPAYRTIANHRHIPRLIPSGSIPTKEEVSANISSFFSLEQRPELPQCGHSLLIDGVAVDERGCYDRENNEVIGFCREHVVGLDRRVTNMASVEYLSGLTQGKDASLHYGSEASVVAIAAHRSDHYQAIPLVVSTKCGTETGVECASWLKIVMESWESHEFGARHNGPIWTVASDGEASLRNSRFNLCMDRDLDRSSPLGKKLSRLSGLNLRTGPGDVTMTADYKHAFKRHATQLRTRDGFQVWDGMCNRHRLLHFLVKLHGMSEEKAHQLLDPADKQNVPKAVSLLQAICSLQKFPLDPLLPSEQSDLRRFHFLGEVLSSFLLPFITLDMPLDQQIISLVKYAHLICACWIRHGNSFMSGALYADGQAIVKNIVFSLVKQQILDETADFHIILDGTDRLEQVFSDARTQDHSRNFDVLRLSQKLATASTINNILLRNPELDRGHTRLSLAGASGVDHVNPTSCTGNLISGSVNIQALWASGQREANAVLVQYFGEGAAIAFTTLFSDPTKDLLRPEGKYVGATASDSMDEYHEGNCTPSDNAPVSIVPSADSNDEDNIDDVAARAANVDIEDLLPSSPGQPIQILPSTHFLPGADGKEYYKGSIVSSYFRGGRSKKVVERTLRARGVTLESLRESQNLNTTDVLSGDGAVITGDLAATIARAGEQVCLIVINIVGFIFNKSRVDRVAVEVLERMDTNLVVTGEVLEILPMRSHDESTNLSWAWSLGYLSSTPKGKSSKLTVKQTTFRFPGWLIIPLCPTLRPATLVHDNPPQPYTWVFEAEILEESLSQLWSLVEHQYPDQAHEALADLPSLLIDELPYRSGDDQEYFVINNLVPVKQIGGLQRETKTPCLICGKPYILGNMRAHVSRHILQSACGQADQKIQELGLEPCGFCGGDECTVKLTSIENGCPKIVSSCRYAYSFNYKSAKQPSRSSPCTNIPIVCPFCSSSNGVHFIWKYNAISHTTVNHPDDLLPLEFLAEMHISLTETQYMRVDLDAMKSYRKLHSLMDSDDFPEGPVSVTGDKRSRALSASSAGGSRKNPRVE